jgi:hypothetical protein
MGVTSWWQKKPIIVLSGGACGGTFMKAARESHIAVVKRLLDFFLPPLFLSLPLGKRASPTKTKEFSSIFFLFQL